MTMRPGVRLGPYEILSPLGRGGMGEVYRARDTRLGREVAVKVLPEDTSRDPDRLRRFEMEARAAGSLDHPNLLAVHDVGSHEGSPYLVTELLEGETLRERLESGGLPVRKAVEYGVEIARGLAAAHDKQLVHRDVKPENLFLTRDGRVKILDFGLAKLREAGDPGSAIATASMTDPGSVVGTAAYMSPEQVRADAVDARSDVFSLGVVLYEMLSRERPFRGETSAEVMTAILREDAPSLAARDPRVPAALDALVHRCLEKRPNDRFESARDLAFALEAVANASGASPGPRDRAPRGWLVPLLATALALTATALVWTLGRLAGEAAVPTYTQLTFRRGDVDSARFAPDGETVVYSASWDGRPSELFSTRIGSRESRALGIEGQLLAVSSRSELAVKLGRYPPMHYRQGTLARVSLAGGSPRALAEGVGAADFDPEGKELAVLRLVGGLARLEYPVGRVLREGPINTAYGLRFLKDGTLAFFERSREGWQLLRVRRTSEVMSRSQPWADPWTLGGWSDATDELWFAADRSGDHDAGLNALSLSGRERLVARVPGDFLLHDVGPRGRVLVNRGSFSRRAMVLAPGTERERDLTWLEFSVAVDVSADGGRVLLHELAAGAPGVYLRAMDGSPAVRLGEGEPFALSPDGRWAVVRQSTSRLVLLPTGAGEPRPIDAACAAFVLDARWFPDGERILIVSGPERPRARLHTLSLAEGTCQPFGPEALWVEPFWGTGLALSPDGRYVAAGAVTRPLALYPVGEGEPRRVPGAEDGDVPQAWSADGKELFVRRPQAVPARVDLLDVRTGARRLWRELMPSDPVGVTVVRRVIPTRDGRGYAYNYNSGLGSLYVGEGLR